MVRNFEDYLYDTSVAFQEDDYVLWRKRVRVPLCLILPTGVKILKSECEARRYFLDCQIAICIQRIDTLICRPVEFEECDHDVALATYETHVFSGSHRTAEPFQSTATLRYKSGNLIAGSILNAVDFRAGHRSRMMRPANHKTLPSTKIGHVRLH